MRKLEEVREVKRMAIAHLISHISYRTSHIVIWIKLQSKQKAFAKCQSPLDKGGRGMDVGAQLLRRGS